MKLTAKLAYSQLLINRKRTVWTLLGIILSTAMITAVYGFIASGDLTLKALLGDDYYNIELYKATIMGIGAFLSALIIIAAVVVISNAFRVSAGERAAQFGLLKSVGATKKQITQTVVYEGLFLSVIGIPAGIIIGLSVDFIGTEIANYLLAGMNDMSEFKIIFEFIIAWQAIVLSAAVAFVTVFLSAWLPARKAAKITAIDAIRGAGEVKIKSKHVRTSKIVQKLFGFEGTLASKSLKRSKRNFRATVVSLTISVILFIAVSGFTSQISKMTDLVFPGINADVAGQYYTPVWYTYGDDGEITQIEYTTIDSNIANDITERLRAFPETTVFGAGSGRYTYSVTVPREMVTSQMRQALSVFDMRTDQDAYELAVSIVVTDPENYAELCRIAGVPFGSNILVNHSRYPINGKKSEFTPFVYSSQNLLLESRYEPSVEIPLHGELVSVPNEVLDVCKGDLNVVVPYHDAHNYLWFAKTNDISGFMEYANTVLSEMVPPGGTGTPVPVTDVIDIKATSAAIRNTAFAIMVFIYGFVGMLTLIGLTNVISTISTNVRSRAREFAVLQSVGMTRDGLNRMLTLESILCSAKSLIIGLPIGTAASWLIYRFIMMSVQFTYEFPWGAILQCVFAVSVITFITMRYAVSRLRGGSIIDKIRAEGGV